MNPVAIRIDENEIRISEYERQDCSRNQHRNQATFARFAKDHEIEWRNGEQDVPSVDHIANDDEKNEYRREPQHEKRFAMVFSSRNKTLRSCRKCSENRESGTKL